MKIFVTKLTIIIAFLFLVGINGCKQEFLDPNYLSKYEPGATLTTVAAMNAALSALF